MSDGPTRRRRKRPAENKGKTRSAKISKHLSPPVECFIREFDITKMKTNVKVMVIGKPGTGKCLHENQKVMMVCGILREAKDIIVGDYVMGHDYTPRKVLSIDKGTDYIYSVRTINYESKPYLVTGNHKLVVFQDHTKSIDHSQHIITLSGKVTSTLITANQLYSHKKQKNRDIVEGNISNIPDYYTIYADWHSFNNTVTYRASHPIQCFYMGEGNYVGLEIEGDHMFLLEGNIVTHNSCLLNDIAYNVRGKIPVAQVYSGTEDTNEAWEKVVPPLYIHNGFDEDASKLSVRRQKLALKVCSIPKCMYIWDDCTDDPAYFRKKVIKSMHKNGRHWEGFYLFCIHYAFDMLPILRTTTDYAFLLQEKNKDNRDRLFKHYANAVHNRAFFDKLMDTFTSKYGCLVVDNTTKENSIEETIFYYKAVRRKNWKFGCKEYRERSEERADPDYIPPMDYD